MDHWDSFLVTEMGVHVASALSDSGVACVASHASYIWACVACFACDSCVQSAPRFWCREVWLRGSKVYLGAWWFAPYSEHVLSRFRGHCVPVGGGEISFRSGRCGKVWDHCGGSVVFIPWEGGIGGRVVVASLLGCGSVMGVNVVHSPVGWFFKGNHPESFP